MDRIEITGGMPLQGEITISGAKNAALPLMVASLLTDEPLALVNVPDLADIRTLSEILAAHGVTAEIAGETTARTLTLSARQITSTVAHYDLVRKMRASFLVIGPLLARCGEAKVSLPGGCAIGTRPVDLHLNALERLGAQIELEDGYVLASAPQGLKGAEIEFPFVSVGATQNLLMAASLAKGDTILRNAAREPETVDLGQCLIAMGAKIEGLGTSTVKLTGVSRLTGARHTVLPDRIEMGTYAMMVGTAGGQLRLRQTDADLIRSVIPVLTHAGLTVKEAPGEVTVSNGGQHLGVDVTTEPYPGFPTDLQAQFMALMSTCQGKSHITETIFENRFMHVPELGRMGARIAIDGQTATVTGVPKLKGAPVMATDLRASVSLIAAALGAEGTTTVSRVYHLDRGFEKIEDKLSKVGAQIRRIRG
ncbi:MAG: UDP-N-acetylglucosamine 1-carboxyvinyltransferase [Alphaproteobacteria bacterium]|nr:MAG: UDP-N-acetylglucosamine 1-carboxyvinyltransferase [Alphaproteobacteria bacterium]